MSLIRWYCGRCKKEFTADTPDTLGMDKAECPRCKGNTKYMEIYELEVLSS